jgi:hypothetical protein
MLLPPLDRAAFRALKKHLKARFQTLFKATYLNSATHLKFP